MVHEIFYASGSASIKSRPKALYFGLRDTAALLMASRISVPNSTRRERIVSRLPELANRVDIIPIAANIEPEPHYRRTPRPHEPIELVAFGIVMPRRRYELAMESLKELRRTLDVRLTIIGRVFDEHEHYMRKCLDYAEYNGIAPFVEFTGALDSREISRRLSEAHLGIHTASEGATRSSGSLLALLAHGVPVVAARTEGDDDCFADSLTYADDNPIALANAIASLVREATFAEETGRRAQERYFADFDWRAIASTVIGIGRLPRLTRRLKAEATVSNTGGAVD
jgi:glycosyltransferase involved in cell wall biosynthesis